MSEKYKPTMPEFKDEDDDDVVSEVLPLVILTGVIYFLIHFVILIVQQLHYRSLI